MYIIFFMTLSLKLYSSIIVGIVDSGVDTNNIFLKSKVIASKNLIEPNNNIKDYEDHGTPIAGIITTIATKAYLACVAACNELGSSSYLDVYDGIRFCVDNKSFIINLSLSFYEENIKDIKNLLGEEEFNKHFFVIAAGNTNEFFEPLNTKFENVLFVGAVSGDGLLASYSNYGDGIDLAAFVGGVNLGVLTCSSCSENKRALNGTSAAAAVVSGYLAKIKEENLSASMLEIKQMLFNKCYKNQLVLVNEGKCLYKEGYEVVKKLF